MEKQTRKQVQVRRIGAVSAAKMMGVLYGLLGLIFGLFISLIALASGGVMQESTGSPIFGVMAIIALPLLYGALGALSGLLMAALYNLVAKYIGGVKIETE